MFPSVQSFCIFVLFVQINTSLSANESFNVELQNERDRKLEVQNSKNVFVSENYANIDNKIVTNENSNFVDGYMTESAGALNQLKGTGLTISNIIAQTFYDISESIHRLLEDAAQTLFQITEETKIFLDKATLHMDKAIGLIGTKIIEISDETIKDLFLNIKGQLRQIKEELADLSVLAEEQFEKVIAHINETMIEKSSDMDLWSKDIKEKLQSIKNVTMHEESCRLVDDFITATVNEMYGCCKIVIKPVRSICGHVKTVLAETFDVVSDVVDKMDKCILQDDAEVHVMIPCLNEAYDSVSNLLSKAAQVRHSLLGTLPIKIVVSDFCISFARVNINHRRDDVEGEIQRKYLS